MKNNIVIKQEENKNIQDYPLNSILSGNLLVINEEDNIDSIYGKVKEVFSFALSLFKGAGKIKHIDAFIEKQPEVIYTYELWHFINGKKHIIDVHQGHKH
jgi:hypothetical protein